MRCRFTWQADQDLSDAAQYIAQDNPQAAIGVITLLEQKCKLLCEYPAMGRLREELAPALRSVPVSSYVIFYRIVTDEVQIIRILHGSRDVTAEFE